MLRNRMRFVTRFAGGYVDPGPPPSGSSRLFMGDGSSFILMGDGSKILLGA